MIWRARGDAHGRERELDSRIRWYISTVQNMNSDVQCRQFVFTRDLGVAFIQYLATALLSCSLLVLGACGGGGGSSSGGGTGSGGGSPQQPPSPDFSISVQPASLSLTPGT